jgi:hypothetical protein
MACTETNSTLRIFSEDVDPSKIGEILGVEATHTIPRDLNSKSRPRRENHYWSWDSRGQVESTDNSEHITAIIKLLEGRSIALEELRGMGCQTDICNYWVGNGQGGPSLDVEMLGALHKLGLPIWWDTYFDHDGVSDK